MIIVGGGYRVEAPIQADLWCHVSGISGPLPSRRLHQLVLCGVGELWNNMEYLHHWHRHLCPGSRAGGRLGAAVQDSRPGQRLLGGGFRITQYQYRDPCCQRGHYLEF